MPSTAKFPLILVPDIQGRPLDGTGNSGIASRLGRAARTGQRGHAVPAGPGMTASQAVTRIAALPARAATTETAPVRADPGTGA